MDTVNVVGDQPNRLGIYLFYDEHGVVDDYVVHMLRALAGHTSKIVVVCNGAPSQEGIAKLEACGVEVFIRENIGFDVFAYKEAIERVGRQAMAQFDELLLMNYTFYGPIFPLAEMFGEMDRRECDIWGITAHAESGSPFEVGQILPMHIQSHFIAVRRRLLADDAFWDYWAKMPMIRSYQDSILQHEARFTQHFNKLGFRASVYMEPEDFASAHPVFIEVDRTIERRSPILKRRVFFHDPLYLEAEAIDLRRALDLVEKKTDYPTQLIWHNIVRSAEPRVLYTNAELLSILPERRLDQNPPAWANWKLAVIMHMYYPELAEEMRSYLANIPLPFDLYVTTTSAEKQAQLRESLQGMPNVRKLDVRLLASNEGRDTSSLFIGCRDVALEGGYDFICRLHGKLSPQDGYNRGTQFKRHLLVNLLGSRGYVENLLDMVAREPATGIVCPSVIHIGYPTLGHGWFYNRPPAKKLADEMNLKVKFDQHTPLAPLGAMYWFRPQALRPLFERNWSWEEFSNESYGDGDIPHAVERLITYCAQSQGYVVHCAMTPEMAAKNYVKLEYKYQILASCFPTGDPRGQVALMLQQAGVAPPTVRQSWQQFWRSLRRSLAFRLGKAS